MAQLSSNVASFSLSARKFLFKIRTNFYSYGTRISALSFLPSSSVASLDCFSSFSLASLSSSSTLALTLPKCAILLLYLPISLFALLIVFLDCKVMNLNKHLRCLSGSGLSVLQKCRHNAYLALRTHLFLASTLSILKHKLRF